MNIAVAAGHEETADTAIEILKAGGNAFDAAIAAYMTAFVAEPCMASGGGGAFANVYKTDGTSLVFDFFCQTPKQKRPLSQVDFYPVEVDFGEATEIFHIGKGSTGVPGSIAGIFAMHKMLGSMPMTELVQPAIQLAKQGVIINDFQAFDLNLLEQIFRVDEKAKDVFFKEDKIMQVGDRMHMYGLADFLEFMSREGEAAFYKGEIAQKIITDYQMSGGYLTQEDFDAYKVIVRKPLAFEYNNRTILTNPVPSTGGSLIALAMSFLKEETHDATALSTEHLLFLYKAFEKLDQLEKLPNTLAKYLHKILQKPNNKRGSTSHLNVVDSKGNAVSLTTTIGEGCGYFIEGTNIQMNNMLGEAALLPNGFHSWDQDVRLSSMMSPTIVLDERKTIELVLGSGGASRIPSAIAQVLHYLLDFDWKLEKAIEAPRVHLEHGVFNIEKGFNHHLGSSSRLDSTIQEAFEILKEWTGSSLFFGGVHCIQKKGDQLFAAGDQRRDGVAVVC